MDAAAVLERTRRLLSLERRAVLTLILVAAVAWSVLAVEISSGLLHTGGLSALRDITVAALSPDLSPGLLKQVGIAAWRTLAYAVAGMTVALVIGLPLGVLASGVFIRPRGARLGVAVPLRGFLAVLRSVHELVWALLFVSAIGLSPMAGVLAIGIPYGGVLGRVLAERLQDVPDRPLEALRAAGASEATVFLYGRLPMALPDIISYLFYRFECAVRAAAVLSFVGLGGLGFRIEVALADLDYSEAWTSIFALIGIIICIDIWSAQVRRRLI